MNEPRKLQEVEPRVETGPVQFGDDWPGIFIRGDDCIGFAQVIQDALTKPPNTKTVYDLTKLQALFDSAIISGGNQIIIIMEDQ